MYMHTHNIIICIIIDMFFIYNITVVLLYYIHYYLSLLWVAPSLLELLSLSVVPTVPECVVWG